MCPWKGTAKFDPASTDKLTLRHPRTAPYYSAVIDGKPTQDIAWYYPGPRDKADHIKDYVAFHKVRSLSQTFGDR